MEGLGTGLAALGFWLMVASAIVGGIWYEIRRKEAQHETLRRLIESGQKVDEETLNKLLGVIDGGTKSDVQDTKAGLKLASTILFFVAPGLILLGIFVDAFMPLMGVAALVLSVGFALAKVADSWDRWYGLEEAEENVEESSE